MELDLITFGVIRDAGELVLSTGGLLGLTGLIGKLLSDVMRDKVLPFVAMFLGVGIAVTFQLAHGDPVSVFGILFGIVFGGSVSGLYAVTKDIKKTPNVVVNE